jgi:glycosyltransferase involved in cell wall biosynthesis
VYNHQDYLEEALNSIFSQKTTFKYEVIVHDDASTDNSRRIIEKYAKMHTNLRAVFNEENQFSQGVTGLQIVKRMPLAKYVASCEGDDFWTDNNKLQIQYDLIESNPNTSIVVHNASIVGNGEVKEFNVGTKKNSFTAQDILECRGQFAATSSYFYRSEVFEISPSWEDAPAGDLMIELYSMKLGFGSIVRKNMSSYRLNVEGSWTERVASDHRFGLAFLDNYEKLLKRAFVEFRLSRSIKLSLNILRVRIRLIRQLYFIYPFKEFLNEIKLREIRFITGIAYYLIFFLMYTGRQRN